MSLLKPLAGIVAVATTAALTVVGTGAAHAADVSLPAVEDNRVSVRVENPIPGKVTWPLVPGQSCAGVLVPPWTLPAVIPAVIPMLDGGLTDILTGLGDLNDLVTILGLGGTAVPTLPGVAGTLAANDVRDDFYVVPVVCMGGRNNAPMEINLFLTQVGSPLGAFEGSVTGSIGGSGSAEGSSVGLGSAELGVGSADGMLELGSASGSDQGSTIGAGFDGSIADVTSGSTEIDLGVGSTGSEAGFDAAKGSIDSASVGALDTSSLTSSVELPAGSSNGSSIDVGSIIPIATDVAGSVGDLSFPGS